VLAAAVVAVTFALARRLGGVRAGVLAAGCLLVSVWFLLNARGYLSHVTAMLALTGAALSLFRSEEGRSDGWPLLAGFLIGFAVATRPVSGILLGGCILVWATCRSPQRAWRIASFVVVGGLAPALALMWYNEVTTGEAFLFGYSRLHGELHAFGFGARGSVVYDHDGRAVETAIRFGPVLAGYQLIRVLTEAQLHFLPASTALPLLWLARARGGAWKSWVPWLFVVLPLALFFYRYSGLRLHSELIPFLAVGFALALRRMDLAWPGSAVRYGSAVAALFLVTVVSGLDETVIGRVPGIEGYYERIRTERQTRGPLVVFVEDRRYPENAALFNILYGLNGPDLTGDVVVARHLGARNADLLAGFPDRSGIHVRWIGPLDSGEEVPVQPLVVDPDRSDRNPPSPHDGS
jgi:4-amino-4-deoxy-L-arabinose transferase-like glycosyltransferase